MLPEIRASIDRSKRDGALFSQMTGSGSCLFGAIRTAAEVMAAINEMRAGILTWTMGAS